MSTNINWRPAKPPPDRTIGDTKLKYILAARYWPGQGDGSLCHMPERTLKMQDVPFLEGLVAAGVESAQKIINLIDKHGEIEIWIE